MRERVIAVDGTCTIARGKPHGTVITITVPVPDDPRGHESRALTSETST